MAKIAITFGLVSIPIRVLATTEDQEVRLHQVHTADGGRIRYRRRCEVCGREVDLSDIAKGYQDPAGRTAVLTEADFDQLPLPSVKAIDVLAFVDATDIDWLSLSRAYYLTADTPSAAKPYILLRDTLTESGKVGVTKVTLRTGSRESLAVLRVRDDVLVLHTMHWPDEVRPPAGLVPPDTVTVRPQEVQMARSLMDSISAGFDLQAQHDDYRHALDQLVTARLEGTSPTVPAAKDTATAPEDVMDLMAALQASIDARAAEGGPPAPAGRKAPAKAKKTARKAAAPTEARASKPSRRRS